MTRTNVMAVVCAVLLSLTSPLLCTKCQASTANTKDALWIRVNKQDIKVTFNGNWTDYANLENCGDPTHRTAKGPRFFGHAHIQYNLPIDGTGSDGNTYTVDNAGIKAYWDNYYGKSSDGGEDCHYNCWAYAFGYTIWIQDPSYIYVDDYVETTDAALGKVIQLPGHAKTITNACNNGDAAWNTIQETKEKNQPSGIYTFDYYCPGGNYPGGTMFKKR